ncbi:GroES chaperonin family [Arabidopsis thaliana x Arabidopsis arenosa]|uniref:GroES chaperonin family n=2 Tax=Arabidopsis TaxID=3701 RepID=A0A8T2AKX5_ARASU|nr:GroES chaperonin family [Arabidopsis thaliana x Arabidopsis arenosa]KAG7574902.1 GroES chaperonin family [Arabidopsis suecica]
MASTFVSLPKPFFAFPVKTTTPSTANHTLLGSRRGCLRIKAISTKWEPTKVVPQGDRVLVRLEDLPMKSSGGVLLPKAAVKFERYLTGEVISVGSEVGQQVGPGKKVLFSDVSAYEVDLGTDARHCFCKESDLLALVE